MRFVAVVPFALTACAAPVAVPPASPLPVVELRYRVFEQVGRPWYCDRDFYPIAREDEKVLARQRLPEMQADAATYAAILTHNRLGAGVTLTDGELLAVYRDWKDLQALTLTTVGTDGTYGFLTLFRSPDPSKQGERVDGRISAGGRITISRRESAGPPPCPICLADTTRIDTPRGPVLVTDLAVGDLVWTTDERGDRVASPIVETGSTVARPGHEVVRVLLADGRAVTASPGHPTADGRTIGSLGVGDELDGSKISAIERVPYSGRTFDLLPAGPTGLYWADGVLLASTLRR